jgi:ABC-type sugar transport system substrate-binding protein
VVEQLGADAEGEVLVIEGLSGNITGQRRAQGFAERLGELAPGLEIVASLPGDWDRAKAADITNDILTRQPDLTAIFAANDTMALGAVETVFAAGKGEDIVVVGVDGNVDAVDSIKSGRLDASVAQLPYLVGKQAVEKASDVLAGKEVDKFTYVPTVVLTQEVLEKGEEPLLEYVK